MILKKIKQIYHPYWNWECYKYGMYSSESFDNGKEMYRDFLSDIPRFKNAIDKIFDEWSLSCEHFLTNPDINRVAWIGQASMCIETGVPRKYRAGFMLLSDEQQKAANDAAMEALIKWVDCNGCS